MQENFGELVGDIISKSNMGKTRTIYLDEYYIPTNALPYIIIY